MNPEERDYRSAGVNREEGYRTVRLISRALDSVRESAQSKGGETLTGENGGGVVSGIGGFASLYELPGNPETLLAAATDGVGTKIELSLRYDRLREIGQDCVAMCLNDLVCHGARPLFFLDYLACEKLEAEKAAKIVEGIAESSARCGALLVGGETAEMPGVYREGRYDVAGFAVGVVERGRVITPEGIRGNEALLALRSSGLHSNGFSLLRALVDDFSQLWEGTPLWELATEPTRLYVNQLLRLHGELPISGAAHITGGGLEENLPRILPPGVDAVVHTKRIGELPVHRFLRTLPVSTEELYRTFNMGVGMVLALPPESVEEALSLLGEEAYLLGELRTGGKGAVWLE
ncbi:MAG: phosphoribosylformylglycinamidine cyclo-ligase [Spirochaetaceae bacterium]